MRDSIRTILGLFVLLSLTLGAQAADEGLSWSTSDTEKTPQGDVTFHGPFSNETVSVKAEKLPAHDFLDITFDLLILRSWDGSVEVGSDNRPGRIGPDIFRASLQDGPTLLYTTFSNRPDDPGFQEASKYQNFPSSVAGDHLAPQTGAAAKNSLGYNYPWPGTPQPFPMDATYHIHLIVPHNAAGAMLQLTGAGLQDIIDESWGVTNLIVQPLASDKVKTPDVNAIASAFAECINPESDKQSEAFATLVTGMDATVDWISVNVSPQPIDSNRVADLIKLLGADDSNIDARESAATELRALGPALEPFLRDARKTAVGEQRARIDWLLACLGVRTIDDENLRKLNLATRVLEIIGTPKAMALRKTLTNQ
jgi:hypothetical protein